MGQEGQAIQAGLAEKLGKSRVTVPQVFINTQLIGGCDDLQAAEASGKLENLIEELKKSGEYCEINFCDLNWADVGKVDSKW